MDHIQALRRPAGVLAWLAGAVLASIAAAPAALAPGPGAPRPPGGVKHLPLPAHTHTLAAAGLTGWQVTLIVIMAALLATAAGATYRLRAAWRRVSATAA